MSTTLRSDALRIGSAVPGHVHGTEDVVADHGLLLGLGDDDHTQYARTDGSRALTGAQVSEYPIAGMRGGKAGRFSAGGNVTGYLLIRIPREWAQSMANFRVEGYNYASGVGGWSLHIAGYMYLGNPTAYWVNTSVDGSLGVLRETDAASVTLLAKGSTAAGDQMYAIAIGSAGSVWTYPQVNLWVDLGFSPLGGATALRQMATISVTTDLSEWTSSQVQTVNQPSASTHNHDAAYVNASGDMMTGTLEIRGPGSLYLHNAGSDHVRLRSGLSNGGYALRVEEPSNAAVLLPVSAANPRMGTDLATADWTRTKYENMMLSGPHGPLSSYETIQHVAGSGVTVFSTCLHHTSVVTGLTHVVIGGYTEIRNVNAYSRASLSAYVYPYGRWHDGTEFRWTNGLNGPQHRHTETKKAGISSGDYGYRSFNIEAWFENQPGKRCSLGMMANVDNAYDGGVYANFGHMRIHVEVYPWATFGADDGPAWGVP